MKPDLFMARGDDSGYNLAIGDPSPLFASFWQAAGAVHAFKGSDLGYPKIDGSPALVEQLQAHYPKKHFVVANGAKQAILAAFYAYKACGKLGVAHATEARWPSYPTLTKMSHLTWDTIPALGRDGYEVSDDDIRLITYPNNPGREPSAKLLRQKWDIWDAAYASATYAFDPKRKPKAKIEIYSAAKLFGIPGLRVGWIATDDEQLATFAKEYVELTTSGVSNFSQAMAAGCLRYTAENPDKWNACMAGVDELICENAAIVTELEDFIPELKSIVETGRSGMFSLINFNHPNFDPSAAGVKLVPGSVCGLEEGWYRVSLGQTNEYTRKAVEALKLALKGA